MSGELILFAAASGLAIAFALAMLFQRTPVRSVLALVVTFFGLAILSILLSAPFVAALQVIVYAGAILVLFLFVIMLLNLDKEAQADDLRPAQRVLSAISVLAFGGLLVGVLWNGGPPPIAPSSSGPPQIPAADEIPLLGRLLFTDYLLAFEAVSVVLLLAAVGALILSKRRFT